MDDAPEKHGAGFDGDRGSAIDAGALPRKFGAFTLLSVLGEGSFGRVYLARQERPSREVAVKILRAEAAAGEALVRFGVEAEALGRLTHPGIARIYEAGTAEGRPYLVMERVVGRVLTRYAGEGGVAAIDLRACAALAASAAEAVDYAHRQGVIHRDLKPANIMVDEQGQARILDFGVARLTSAGAQQTISNLTVAGSWLGTLRYLSPEQVAGEAGDTRSDVHALGVILFELLTGRTPYGAEECTPAMLLAMVRDGAPPRLRALNPRCTVDMEAIVGRALEKDPADRYLSAGELAADLRRMLADEPVRARPPTVARLMARAMRRHKLATLAFGAALAGAVIGVQMWVKTQQEMAAADREARETATVLLNAVVGPMSVYSTMDTSRREMLTKIGPALKRFARTSPNDESVQMNYARYLEMLGDVKIELGESDVALEREELVLLRERFVAAKPEDARRAGALGVARVKLGEWHVRRGAIETGFAEYVRAHAMFDRAYALAPNDQRTVSELGWSYNRLRAMNERLGRPDEADQCQELQLTTADAYLTLAPESSDAAGLVMAAQSGSNRAPSLKTVKEVVRLLGRSTDAIKAGQGKQPSGSR